MYCLQTQPTPLNKNLLLLLLFFLSCISVFLPSHSFCGVVISSLSFEAPTPHSVLFTFLYWFTPLLLILLHFCHLLWSFCDWFLCVLNTTDLFSSFIFCHVSANIGPRLFYGWAGGKINAAPEVRHGCIWNRETIRPVNLLKLMFHSDDDSFCCIFVVKYTDTTTFCTYFRPAQASYCPSNMQHASNMQQSLHIIIIYFIPFHALSFS